MDLQAGLLHPMGEEARSARGLPAMRIVGKLVAVVIVSFPFAAAFTVFVVDVYVSEWRWDLEDKGRLLNAAFFAAWAACILWVLAAPAGRHALSRACRAFSVACLFSPLVAFVAVGTLGAIGMAIVCIPPGVFGWYMAVSFKDYI